MAPGAGRRRGWRVLLTLGLVVIAASVTGLLAAPAASAHAYLTSSNPADGAVLDQAPGQLVLDFSESVVLPAMTVTVADGEGHRVAVGAPTLVVAPSASAGGDTEAPVSVQVSLPHLAKGSYRISWETVSSDDLHRAAGVLVFGVQTTVVPQGWVESAPDALESALRWVVLLAIAAAVGTPVARTLLRRAGPRVDAAMTVTVLRWCASLGLLAALALLADQVVSSGGTVGALVSGGYAARWVVRTGGLLLVLLATLPTFTSRPAPSHPKAASVSRGRQAVVVLGAALAALGTAMLGHSGAGLVATPTRVTAAALHVLATGCWMGTLAVIVLVVLRQRPPARVVVRVLRAFGPVAAASVGVMVVTGLYLASGVVGSVDALLLTDYGRILMAKVLVVLGCGGLALVTRRRLRRSGDQHLSGGLGRSGLRLVVAEVVLGGLVLALTGLLSSGQPALERQLTTDPSVPASTTVYQRVADLELSVAIRPNLPGQNVAIVRVSSSRRPAPAPVTGVAIAAAGSPGGTATATPIGDDQWSVPLTLTESGPGTVRVSIVRTGMSTTTGAVGWTTGWPPGSASVLLSRTPLQPVLGWAALVALVASGIGLLVAIRAAATRPPRRRKRSGEEGPIAPVQAETPGAQARSEPIASAAAPR
ncbi:MAG: copper resistance protein CopC [Lapillicoccus sp.]